MNERPLSIEHAALLKVATLNSAKAVRSLITAIDSFPPLCMEGDFTDGQRKQAWSIYKHDPESGVRYLRAIEYFRRTGRTVCCRRFSCLGEDEKAEVVSLRRQGKTFQQIKDITGFSWRIIKRCTDEAGCANR